MQRIIEFLIAIAVAAGIFFLGRLTRQNEPILEPSSTKTDTLLVFDTIAVETPLFVERRVTDTIWLETIVHERDTIVVSLPREQKVYQDSTYRAVVSGYLPSLDSLLLTIPTKTITTTEVRTEFRKWSFGAQAGLGILIPFNNTPQVGGYLGYGITYNF